MSGIEPVSTVNSVTAGSLSFFGATSGSGDFTVTSNTTDYLMFDIYFRNDGDAALTLKLGATSSVTDGANDKNTSLTTRVAFINQGNDTIANAAAGSLTAVRGGSSAYFWEPNSLVRTPNAISKGGINQAKYTYYGMNQAGTYTSLDNYGLINMGSGLSHVTNTNDLAVGDSDAITTLAVSAVTKVSVYVWMEGQDIDHDNGVSAGDVAINFSFDSATDDILSDSYSVVADNAATALSGTTVTLSGTSTLGATYAAYAMDSAADPINSNLTRKVLLGSGSFVAVDTTLAEITLGTSGAGADEVVVTGIFEGSVSSRTVYNP